MGNAFYSFGELRNITLVPKQGCAFVQFTQRKSAEKAAEGTFNKLLIKDNKITSWYSSSRGFQQLLWAGWPCWWPGPSSEPTSSRDGSPSSLPKPRPEQDGSACPKSSESIPIVLIRYP